MLTCATEEGVEICFRAWRGGAAVAMTAAHLKPLSFDLVPLNYTSLVSLFIELEEWKLFNRAQPFCCPSTAADYIPGWVHVIVRLPLFDFLVSL